MNGYAAFVIVEYPAAKDADATLSDEDVLVPPSTKGVVPLVAEAAPPSAPVQTAFEGQHAMFPF